MKNQIGAVLALWLATCAFAKATSDSSYLLVQGDFGPQVGGSNSEETFKFQVNYPAGDTNMSTGQDLLNAVFGNPQYDGTDPMTSGTLYRAGTASQNVEYDLDKYGLYLVAFTFNSITVHSNDTSSPTLDWNYYVAGGNGVNGNDFNGGEYPNGTWTSSNDGDADRYLANNSFDGWVFGSSGYDPYPPGNADGSTATIDGANNEPTDTDFAGAMIIDVPEPRSMALVASAAAFFCWRTKRRG